MRYRRDAFTVAQPPTEPPRPSRQTDPGPLALLIVATWVVSVVAVVGALHINARLGLSDAVMQAVRGWGL